MTAEEALKQRDRVSRRLHDVACHTPALRDVVSGFAPIELEDVADAALLQRVTSKMVMPESLLVQTLQALGDAYRVLDIDGRRSHRYQTQYFDTPDYVLYRQHHNGLRPRYKVRIRTYGDAGMAFLEVKRKSNQNVTLKERLQVPGVATGIDACGCEFLASTFPYPVDWLRPTLWNQFQRTTLVSTHRAERVTLDTSLTLRLGRAEIQFPELAIAEVKLPDHTGHSEFMAQLRALGVLPISFSKYCLGISLLVPHVKTNRFKPQHLLLGRIMQEGDNAWMNH